MFTVYNDVNINNTRSRFITLMNRRFYYGHLQVAYSLLYLINTVGIYFMTVDYRPSFRKYHVAIYVKIIYSVGKCRRYTWTVINTFIKKILTSINIIIIMTLSSSVKSVYCAKRGTARSARHFQPTGYHGFQIQLFFVFFLFTSKSPKPVLVGQLTSTLFPWALTVHRPT